MWRPGGEPTSVMDKLIGILTAAFSLFHLQPLVEHPTGTAKQSANNDVHLQ